MAPPTSYDPESLDEQPIPLPNAALLRISQNIVLQPPLSRRGTGPGIVIFLPNPAQVVFTDQSAPKPLDPDPIIKWAEEGFAVVAITGSNDLPSIVQALKEALEVLQTLEQVDVKQKFAVISEYHGQMHRRSSFFLIFFFFSSKSTIRKSCTLSRRLLPRNLSLQHLWATGHFLFQRVRLSRLCCTWLLMHPPSPWQIVQID